MKLDDHLSATAASLLHAAGKDSFLSLRYKSMAGDGSPRLFFRLAADNGGTLILVLPAEKSSRELAESRSAWLIGKHLHRLGVPVPELYGWDEESGMLLFEDLGDCRLQDIAHTEEGQDVYRDVVRDLARMQCCGVQGFDIDWCWDTPYYDKDLMLERESGYFLRAFWQGILAQDTPYALLEEFDHLTTDVSSFSTQFFLHRDFQSRNIMVADGIPRIIDFQGGRRGPLGYDLASLLNDPYVGIPASFRKELEKVFLLEVQKYTDISEKNFTRQYEQLGCMRSLQIIGAFSWLSTVQKKPFFADFIAPALDTLGHQLKSEALASYPILRNTVEKAAQLFASKS